MPMSDTLHDCEDLAEQNAGCLLTNEVRRYCDQAQVKRLRRLDEALHDPEDSAVRRDVESYQSDSPSASVRRTMQPTHAFDTP